MNGVILNHAASKAEKSKTYRLVGAVGAGLAAMMLMAAAFGTAPNSIVFEGKITEVVEQLGTPLPVTLDAEHDAVAREIVIQRGDTLASVLARAGVSNAEAIQFLRSDTLGTLLARQLVPGKTLSVKVSPEGGLENLIYPISGEQAPSALIVERREENYQARLQPITSERAIQLKSARIQHSLFAATDEAGIPDSIAIQLAEIFGSDIDFHRDLRQGDRFTVIYETTNLHGRPLGVPRILAAEFINDGRVHRAFWHATAEGAGAYYSSDGRSLKKAFLRSPLEFSRITSGFSMARYHPVLQEVRAHRGIDYAAPIGTRVRATGAGIIDFVGVQGGYGKVVMIKHAGNRLTVYGHLSGFAPGIKKGARVEQGQTIGYVGMTGLATGPHLHYEFRVDGIHRNPLAMTLPEAPPLAGQSLLAFKEKVHDLAQLIDRAREVRLARFD